MIYVKVGRLKALSLETNARVITRYFYSDLAGKYHELIYTRFPSKKVEEWLDENCKGRWWYVYNRRFTNIEDIIMTPRERDEIYQANREGKATPEMLDRVRSEPEFAFENKDDALMFKLSWTA